MHTYPITLSQYTSAKADCYNVVEYGIKVVDDFIVSHILGTLYSTQFLCFIIMGNL